MSVSSAQGEPVPSATPAPPNPAATPAPSGSPGAAPVNPFAGGFPFQVPSPANYSTFIRGVERQSGLFDVLKKDEDYYFELGADQLNKPYIIAPVLAAGIGGNGFAGRAFPEIVIEFKRVGKRLLWVTPNYNFQAIDDPAARAALAISVADSVIASWPIVAEDKDRERIVISASYFVGDPVGLGPLLGTPQAGPFGLFLRPSFTVDSSKSYIERVKALPKNIEILSNLAFNGPAGSVTAAPEARGVRVKMHYSIVQVPETTGYMPRLADDRVGYFITALKRFGDDTAPTPLVRYIERWNMAKAPIVFYLTNEIPAQYKPAIRAGILEWNDAFKKIGYPNAIVVKDQPDDPAWDPDDVRYSTVRWLTSDRSPFEAAASPIRNPFTGEVIRAEVVIEGEAMRSMKRGYVEIIRPARGLRSHQELEGCEAADCSYRERSVELAAAGTLALRLDGATAAQTEQFARDYLRSVVLHETGHAFGLRHNFQASTLYSLRDLHDKKFTREHGLVGSVMEYTPVNLSPKGEPQGDFFQLKLGPYDYWAIKYGYSRFPNIKKPEDEVAQLRTIARESTKPELAYGTDEDADGPAALDPRIAPFDLSSDPLAYDANLFAVADGLFANLDRLYPRDDRTFYEERLAFLTTLRSYESAAFLATRYIGGLYTSRTHRGQPGGQAPFRSIPRQKQRQAFDLIARHVLGAGAFHFPPQLLANLGSDRYKFHWNATPLTSRPDFPISDYLASIQDGVVDELFSPTVLSRLVDERLKIGRGDQTMSIEDLFGWTQSAVWSELEGPVRAIEPIHRGVQRRFTNLLIAYALAPSALVDRIGYPNETPALARYHLKRLEPAVDRALRAGRLDVGTRAHLEDIRHRVAEALAARPTQSL